MDKITRQESKTNTCRRLGSEGELGGGVLGGSGHVD